MLTRSSGWWKGVDARRRLAWLDVALVVMVAAALSGPFALRIYYLEIGGRALDEAQAFAAMHPGAVNPALDRAIRYLQRAVANGPQDGYAHRRLGQAWLLLGNNEEAVKSLRRAVELRPSHPLTHIELGYAYDGLGQVDQALAEYEQGGYGPAVEAAIVNYLEVADWHVAAGGGNEALHILNDRVLRLDPTNLPALYRAVKIYQGMSEQAAKEFAEPMRERLQHFQLAGVTVPSEPRLAEYLARTMASLVNEGIWQQDTLLNVVSYQVWQFAKGPSAQATERLLQALLRKWPEDPDLLFYLAELYHRQGELERAKAAYRQVLMADPDYASAYLHLGMIAEGGSGERLTESAGRYGAYYERMPGDVLGLEKLTQVCTMLEEKNITDPSCDQAAQRALASASRAEGNLALSPAAALQQALESRIDDRRIVAEMLGASADGVELGPNLVENSGFEALEGTGIARWRLGLYLGQGEAQALYYAGEDTLVPGRQAARVTALWGEPMTNGTTPYAEYVGQGFTVGDAKYLVSVCYRSQGFAEGSIFVYLGELTASDRLVLVHAALSDSGGQWRATHLIVDGPKEPTLVVPLVRNWGVGQLWVRSFVVRPIVHVKGMLQ